MSTAFAAGEERWRARLGTLREAVRQELVSRQLAGHLGDRTGLRVLDLGCGQGTQALFLARRGHVVIGLDRSAPLLGDLSRALRAEPPPVADRVRPVLGDALSAADLFGAAGFDVVLCHGVLMYLPDPAPLLAVIARVLAPGGLVSLLVRNGDALAMRPGLLGDWPAAAAAFDETGYVNRIGVRARADRMDDLAAGLAGLGLGVEGWYGVRVFTDAAGDEAPVPGPDTFGLLLDCEERAGRTDPYRAVAALRHVLARRSVGRQVRNRGVGP